MTFNVILLLYLSRRDYYGNLIKIIANRVSCTYCMQYTCESSQKNYCVKGQILSILITNRVLYCWRNC